MSSYLLVLLVCMGIEITMAARRSLVDERETILHYQHILGTMKSSNIEENLRYLTEYPHPPGSERNTELANEIASRWRRSGFDKTEIFPYNIYLSYPKAPGEISLLRDGTVTKKMVIENEARHDESEKKGKPLWPYNAYSPSGDVTAEYIYGNYGRESDFDVLEQLGIDINGTIMVFRYGKTSRGTKVMRAQKRGAVGVVLYSDPADYLPRPAEAYPNGWSLAEDGVQRGTLNQLTGDALSLGYPAKTNYFRKSTDKYSGNPEIPSQPISYGSAYHLLKFMTDDTTPLPSDFKGNMNLTYVLRSGKNRQMRLKVVSEFVTRECLTVCTTLFGKKEPDRYVAMGSHRDSWVYGASDASSGTSTLMEIVRALGQFKKETGWRPKRSIMACSWGAEEVGTLGSSEWADENHAFLMRNVVAYLNADVAVEGNYTLNLKALEMAREGVEKAAMLVQAPDDPKKSLYEIWGARSVILGKSKNASIPYLKTPTSYSDYKSLWHTYGTPVVDFSYTINEKHQGVNFYPQYHTLHDSFGWMKKYVDPDFRFHLGIGKLMAGYSLIVADSLLIPFDIVAFTTQGKSYLNLFEEAYGSVLQKHEISLKFAHERLDALIEKAKQFMKYVDELQLSRTSEYEIRSLNDKIMNFERNFLVAGISKKLSARHVIYSIVPNTLKSTKFPGISEAIFYATKNGSKDWDEVRKQITLLIWCIDTANRSLDVSEWKH